MSGSPRLSGAISTAIPSQRLTQCPHTEVPEVSVADKGECVGVGVQLIGHDVVVVHYL